VPFLVARLAELGARVVCLAGAKTDEAIPFRVERPRAGRATLPEIEALGAAVTFVSEAVEGILITQLVEARLGEFGDAAEMFAIGPPAMLKRLHEVAGVHIPLQVSLEERMACGVGACRSCVVRLRSDGGPRYQTVCRDGPVFPSSEIDWERLVP
jgi:dihydroorotate dehydrogenase electron transfer subunit